MAQAFFGGVHPNDMKAATNEKAIEQLAAPAEVVIPMSMHIGAPCKPIVAVGDKVKIGQRIGEPGGFVSAPIHASVSGTVKAVSDRYGFTDTARTEADDYWTGGLITWTSGANTGRKMEIRSFASGVFDLFLPMPSEIAVGDTYAVQPGCDKSFSTCCAKYNNAANFRGEPHVPGTDAVLSYPDGK